LNKAAAKKILNEALGRGRDHGSEILFKCPKCNHHKSKLSVNVSKNVFKCWICDYRGRSIRRLIRSFGTYTQLQKWDAIFGREDLERFDDLFAERSVERNDQTVDLPEEFVSLCHDNIPKTGIYARNYLKSRGITDEQIIKWKIGYCFSGEYRNRIVVPSFNDDGNVSYFVARSYNGDTYKYKNPRASKNIVFNELYVNWSEDLILVEGVFDAINAGNSVPILGSTLRTDSSLIKKIVYNDTPVYIALDPDAAEKERKVIKTLLKYDVELYKIDVTGYEDVGSMSKDVFEERKQNAVFIDRDNYLLLDLLSAV
jgi:DNA primase